MPWTGSCFLLIATRLPRACSWQRRVDIPSIIVTAGPMMTGRYKGRRISFIRNTFEAMGRFKKGDNEKDLMACEIGACPGAGSCQGLYTANTMNCLTEAMGMSLPNCGTAPAVASEKRRIAFDSGERIVELIKRILRRGRFSQGPPSRTR